MTLQDGVLDHVTSCPGVSGGRRHELDIPRKRLPMIDPIEYAWRHCNPGVPFPKQLERDARSLSPKRSA